MSNYLMTFDIGTTSIKTCLFSDVFERLALHIQEYELLTPGTNLVELEPEKYWDLVKAGCAYIIDQLKIDPYEITAITITTQGETLIPVDVDGNTLHNAIIWLDARAVDEVDYINRLISKDEFYKSTGIPEISPATPISKILWFMRNKPDAYSKTFKFLLLEDFIIYKLTGKFVTEYSLMSSTGYFDIKQSSLQVDWLEKLGIREDLFPRMLPSGKAVGQITGKAAVETGLSTSILVITGAMDQVCSAIGLGNAEPGIVTETTGTALVTASTVAKWDIENTAGVSVLRHFDHRFLLLPYCSTAGILLKWFKDSFLSEEVRECEENGLSIYAKMDDLAYAVAPGCNKLLLFPHFAGSLGKVNDPKAKGVFFGVGLDTKKEHFVRAILESIGFMLRENLELLENAGVVIREVRSAGGGSKSKLWNNIKADIIDKVIAVTEEEESTSLGAAILGAWGAGLYRDVYEICSRFVKIKKKYLPDANNREIYNEAYTKYSQLYDRLKELF